MDGTGARAWGREGSWNDTGLPAEKPLSLSPDQSVLPVGFTPAMTPDPEPSGQAPVVATAQTARLQRPLTSSHGPSWEGRPMVGRDCASVGRGGCRWVLGRRRPMLVLITLALSLALPIVGLASQTGDPDVGFLGRIGSSGSDMGSSDGLFGVVRSWSDLALGGVLGTAIGYLIKWILEQLSLRVAARREFAQKVTEQISGLADDYYWGLANYAGVIAGALEGYLQLRSYDLLRHWEQKQPLRNRLNELADKAAGRSFPYLCRLISLFYSFQFEGSNTYLLTDHAAGETCKRLYNAFVSSLPQDKLNLANLYALEIEYDEDKRCKVSEIPPAHLTKEVIQRNNELKETYEAWRNWLRDDLGGVIQAADALRAYNELLLHELAKLYRDWFGRQQPDVPYVEEVVLDAWPNVLTEQSFVAIGRALQQPALLAPLGSAVSAKPSPESQGQKKEPPPEQEQTPASAPEGDQYRKEKPTAGKPTESPPKAPPQKTGEPPPKAAPEKSPLEVMSKEVDAGGGMGPETERQR